MISTQAINYAVTIARVKLPAETNGRLERAVELVKADALYYQGDGEWIVASQADPSKHYRVNGHCNCPDAEHEQAPLGLCKHRLAVWITKKAAKLHYCPACNGTGTFRSYEQIQGLGLVPWERTCQVCEGRGVITREQGEELTFEEPALQMA